jgi:hypothetical protein
MSKMTWIKILLCVVVIGTMMFYIYSWNISLEPPKKVPPPKTQILVDVVMPAYAQAEQSDLVLYKKDPEAYADRFNRNSELYNRSLSLVENGVEAGDTVQLKYFHQYNPPQETYWKVVSIKPPFYESVENGEQSYVEHVKGVVRVAVK